MDPDVQVTRRLWVSAFNIESQHKMRVSLVVVLELLIHDRILSEFGVGVFRRATNTINGCSPCVTEIPPAVRKRACCVVEFVIYEPLNKLSTAPGEEARST